MVVRDASKREKEARRFSAYKASTDLVAQSDWQPNWNHVLYVCVYTPIDPQTSFSAVQVWTYVNSVVESFSLLYKLMYLLKTDSDNSFGIITDTNRTARPFASQTLCVQGRLFLYTWVSHWSIRCTFWSPFPVAPKSFQMIYILCYIDHHLCKPSRSSLKSWSTRDLTPILLHSHSSS